MIFSCRQRAHYFSRYDMRAQRAAPCHMRALWCAILFAIYAIRCRHYILFDIIICFSRRALKDKTPHAPYAIYFLPTPATKICFLSFFLLLIRLFIFIYYLRRQRLSYIHYAAAIMIFWYDDDMPAFPAPRGVRYTPLKMLFMILLRLRDAFRLRTLLCCAARHYHSKSSPRRPPLLCRHAVFLLAAAAFHIYDMMIWERERYDILLCARCALFRPPRHAAAAAFFI